MARGNRQPCGGCQARLREISRLDSDIRFVIADDGIGLGTGIGRGQRNMRARAQNMGGRIEWEAADPGCRVVLIVPEVRIRKET